MKPFTLYPNVKTLIHLLLILEIVASSLSRLSSCETDLGCASWASSIVGRRERNSSHNQNGYVESYLLNPRHVFIHQTWSQNYDQDRITCNSVQACSEYLRALQELHKSDKNKPDISYNFLIAPDGTVFEGVGWTRQGFHTHNYNNNSLGIGLIGNYQRLYPTRQMELALENLLRCAIKFGYLSQNYVLHGHRDARCTTCPGMAAYERLQHFPHYQAGPLDRYSCPDDISSHRVKRDASFGQKETTTTIEHSTQNVSNTKPNNQIIHDNDGSVLANDPQRQWPVFKKSLDALATQSHPGGRESAAISKGGASDKLIVINMPPASAGAGERGSSTQQIVKPSFYLLTTKTKSTPNVLLMSSYSPVPSDASRNSQSSSAAGGSGDGNSRDPPNSGNSSAGGNGGSGSYKNNESGFNMASSSGSNSDPSSDSSSNGGRGRGGNSPPGDGRLSKGESLRQWANGNGGESLSS